ncbi:MAG: 16S rRNA (cytidine(1402)-2'-O)-methyltransferase [Gammaproteobacteria bacterium]|nr:16S rRNA (cytidine(1402)-2'-O)-methyltransferase [Gammaproteobacteria bacterium]
MCDPPATLFVVATPIGNLADLSPRARDLLASVDLIAAEDTRHSARLLEAWEIRTPLTSFHDHNAASRLPELIGRLQAGDRLALITDAGTPLISDPGYRLVRAAQDAGIAVRALPGPSAAIAALSVAGLACDRFTFEGFLPARASARRKRLGELADEPRTMIFYESPRRLPAMLDDCVVAFGADRESALARELTKLHESLHRAPLSQLARMIGEGEEPARGECVVLVAGARGIQSGGHFADELLDALVGEGIGAKSAAAVARRLTGQPRRKLYQRALELNDQKEARNSQERRPPPR